MRRKGCRDLFYAIYDHRVQPEDSYALEIFLFQGKVFRSSKSHLRYMRLVCVNCGEMLLVEFTGDLSFI